MKIGFAIDMITAAEKRWGNEKYKKIKEAGFDCIDYALADTETFVYSLPDGELRAFLAKEKALADEAGIEIWQVHGPWRWPPQDLTEEQLSERMEKMKKSIYMSHLLGCKYWVVHPIMPFGIEDIGTGNEQATWDMNVSFMSRLLETAVEYDVVICFENMPMRKFSMATPEKMLEFARLMNNEHFKICLDTGHVSVIKGLSVGDEVRRLGSEIKVFHIHDNRGSLDEHRFPYFGIIDWGDFSKALRDIGFDGVFSLEATVPGKLPGDLYDEMCRSLCNIAKSIINL